MIDDLQTAIEQISRLPPEQQAFVARPLHDIANDQGREFIVPIAILAALEQLQRGERASPEAVNHALRQPWA